MKSDNCNTKSLTNKVFDYWCDDGVSCSHSQHWVILNRNGTVTSCIICDSIKSPMYSIIQNAD